MLIEWGKRIRLKIRVFEKIQNDEATVLKVL